MNGPFHSLRRTRNQDGFILPLTMIIIFLLFSFLLYEIKAYQSEKQFLYYREEMFTVNDLMQMAAVDLEQRFAASLPDKNYGTFDYINGKVSYTISQPPKDADLPGSSPQDVIYITLKAQADNEGEHVSFAYYDKKKRKIIRWAEQL